jgi:hypothetical protein
VTKREQWQDPDTSNSVSVEARRYYAVSRRRQSVGAHGGALPFLFVRQRTVDQIEVSERRELDAEAKCASAPCTVAKGVSARLTNSVAGQCTVQGLVANTLLGRPKDSVFFHTGD